MIYQLSWMLSEQWICQSNDNKFDFRPVDSRQVMIDCPWLQEPIEWRNLMTLLGFENFVGVHVPVQTCSKNKNVITVKILLPGQVKFSMYRQTW